MPLLITYLILTTKTYIKKLRKSQVNNLIIHLKALGKQEQRIPKNSSLEEITNIRVELTGIKTRQQYKESMTQSLF